jgi:hypothetical protein
MSAKVEPPSCLLYSHHNHGLDFDITKPFPSVIYCVPLCTRTHEAYPSQSFYQGPIQVRWNTPKTFPRPWLQGPKEMSFYFGEASPFKPNQLIWKRMLDFGPRGSKAGCEVNIHPVLVRLFIKDLAKTFRFMATLIYRPQKEVSWIFNSIVFHRISSHHSLQNSPLNGL